MKCWLSLHASILLDLLALRKMHGLELSLLHYSKIDFRKVLSCGFLCSDFQMNLLVSPNF